MIARVLLWAVAPMSVLNGRGPAARTLAHLGWWLVIVSAVVIVVVAVIVLVAGIRSRAGGISSQDPIGTTPGEMRWIYVGGVGVPAVILVLSLAFTLGALAHAGVPPRKPAITVEVIGHRWWWELRYRTPGGGDSIVTANEMHVPVGEPVRLELTTDDVIHSYWVPLLNGKTDLVPGQTNVTWIEADSAGVYRGQCTEYCGAEHANMATFVIAEPRSRFERWLATQRAAAAAPADSVARMGAAVFQRSACAACHTIRGTAAVGRLGPDLTHVAGRGTLAAGTLPNTPGALMGWISNAQALKPGALMPAMPLSPDELHAVAAYLQTLK